MEVSKSWPIQYSNRVYIFKGGKWIDSFMVACDDNLSDSLTLELVEMMELKILSTARERGYTGVGTVNTNPVTQVQYFDLASRIIFIFHFLYT